MWTVDQVQVVPNYPGQGSDAGQRAEAVVHRELGLLGHLGSGEGSR